MKETKIDDLNKTDALAMLAELIDWIGTAYDLRPPAPNFAAWLLNVLKKHFGYLTFEHLQLAFEYNSIGSLNEYLPSNNQYADNKVRYTIPDMTKIIRAYVKLRKLDESEIEEEEQIAPEKRRKIRKEWIYLLNQVFEKYSQKGERAIIALPLYTCKTLAGCGYIENAAINTEKQPVASAFLAAAGRRPSALQNETLIYEAFDKMIAEGISPKDIIDNIDEMPY